MNGKTPLTWRTCALPLKRLAPLAWRRAWRRRAEERALARLAQIASQPRRLGPRSLEGLTLYLVGFLDRPSGVGTAARGLLAAAGSAGLRVAPVDCERPDEIALWARRLLDPDAVSLLVLNPDALARLAHRVGPERLAASHSIGHWVWELEEFPSRFRPAGRVVREVWTPSEFVRRAIRRGLPLPVGLLPYAVAPASALPDRAAWGLAPETYAALTVCDLRSEVTRKNPQAVIAAFRRAFPRVGPARLIVKVQNVDHDPAAWRDLQSLAGGRPDVQFVNEVYDPRRMAALFASCDLYVSLHRAEGFGLCLAEAMAHGKPVLATAYSGSTDFVNFTTGCPIGCRLVEAPREFGPYPRGARWAEADVAEAAARWRRLAEDRERGHRLGESAARRIAELYSPEAIGRQMRVGLAASLRLHRARAA